MTKRELTKKLKALDRIDNKAYLLQHKVADLRNEIAVAIAPCKVGDLIEGGRTARRRGYVRKIMSYHSGFPCVVYIQPLGRKGKLLVRWSALHYPETVKVITPA